MRGFRFLITLLFSLACFSAHAAPSLQDALPTPYPAPEFAGIDTWLNSKPLTLASLKGKVVLVDFWAYSCINCVRTLPYLTKWDADYRGKGLVIIGVHAPEFEFEKSAANVEAAMERRGIKYPVALDNSLGTWNAFHNRYWPAHYLIDKNGNVVYTHFGEGNYAETENNIRVLLGLSTKAESAPEANPFSSGQTPETYLGTARADRFASPEKPVINTDQLFTLPQSLPADHWALSGKWHIEGERIIGGEAGAKLRLNFTSSKVFLVLGTHDNSPIKVAVSLNGEPRGEITVDKHTLYELVHQDNPKNALLEITASRPGLEAYAFTFGN